MERNPISKQCRSADGERVVASIIHLLDKQKCFPPGGKNTTWQKINTPSRKREGVWMGCTLTTPWSLHKNNLCALRDVHEFHCAKHLGASIKSSLVSFIMSIDILQP
jgi:hypothetical protein